MANYRSIKIQLQDFLARRLPAEGSGLTQGKLIKIAIAGACSLLALVLFMVGYADEEIPPDKETAMLWLCTHCLQEFEIFAGETDRMKAEVCEVAPSGGKAASRPSARRSAALTRLSAECPECDEYTGVSAHRCGSCTTVFAARDDNDMLAICHGCEWDPTTGKKATASRIKTLQRGGPPPLAERDEGDG